MGNHFLCAFHHSKFFPCHHKKHWLVHLKRDLKGLPEIDLHQKNHQKSYQKDRPYHRKGLQPHLQYLLLLHQVQPMGFQSLIQKGHLDLHHKEGLQYNELHLAHLLYLNTFALALIPYRSFQKALLFLKHLLFRQFYRKHP